MSQTVMRPAQHESRLATPSAARSLAALVGASALAIAMVYVLSIVVGRIA